MAGLESHVTSAVAVAWEKKREVCVRSHFFWPSWEVRGQLDADPVSSSRKRANPLLLCPSLLFAVSNAVFTFCFGFRPLVSLQSLRLTAIKVSANAVSKSKHHNIKRFTTTRPGAGHWLFEELCPFTLVKHVKKSRVVMPCVREIFTRWECWALGHSGLRVHHVSFSFKKKILTH